MTTHDTRVETWYLATQEQASELRMLKIKRDIEAARLAATEDRIAKLMAEAVLPYMVSFIEEG